MKSSNALKLAFMLLSGFVALWPQTGLTQAKAKFTARIGHLEAPTQARHQGLLKIAQLVKERTNGDVELQIFDSSRLGNQSQMTEGTQLGTIEGTVSPAAFLGGFNPVVSILDIPYLYPTSRTASQKLREGPFGKAILDSFSSRGMVALSIWPNGRKSMTSNRQLSNLDAYKGQKFRVMDSKILQEQFAAVGASALSIAFGELYTALLTGVVDGQENPLDTIATMKYYEVQKNLVVTEHGVMEDIVLFNPGWWKSLPANYRQVIANAFDEVRPEVEKTKEAAQQVALDTIRKAGVQVRTAEETERQRLSQAMYAKSKAAFLELAGAEGAKVVAIYEAELKRVGN
jgi:tripartite ATP-independent transporter DctP family solute receptor